MQFWIIFCLFCSLTIHIYETICGNFLDSTADYIKGIESIDEQTGLHLNGLRCVTVLIGVYVQSTGTPVLGVVNQPFYNNTNSQYVR